MLMKMKFCKLREFNTSPKWEKLRVRNIFSFCDKYIFRYEFFPQAEILILLIIFLVAMLERNLMRLFYNFHHPDRQLEDRYESALEAQRPAPWYGNSVQLYTALAATAILGMMLARSK